MLTEKQSALLHYIHTTMKGRDISPSFDEMRQALGLKSKSGVHRLVTALVERGYLRRLPNRARALEVLKVPDDIERGEQSEKANIFASENRGAHPVPLFGKIAAGTPIEAIRHEGEYVDTPLNLLGKGEYYALVVDGDSMQRIGVNDGDTAIVKRTETARNGDIVVALVCGADVTLKRFERKGDMINLIPENDNYSIQSYPSQDIEIQGVLSSLIRKY